MTNEQREKYRIEAAISALGGLISLDRDCTMKDDVRHAIDYGDLFVEELERTEPECEHEYDLGGFFPRSCKKCGVTRTMTIIEALKTGKDIRRKGDPKHAGSNGDGWLGNYFIRAQLVGRLISEKDLLADDWEVNECLK